MVSLIEADFYNFVLSRFRSLIHLSHQVGSISIIWLL